MIRIDFETRSKLDLKKVGAWVYSKDPSTTVLCMAYKLDNKKTGIWIPNESNWPSKLDSAIGQLDLIEAHNAFFEYSIWNNIMVPKYSWPQLPVKVWRCSAARAAAYGLPHSLDGAVKAIGLPIEKDMVGHRIMLKLSRPRKPTKNNPAIWHEDPADYKKLYKYCKQDVETEYALSKAIPELSKEELLYWKLDQRINRRGVYCDLKTVKNANKIIKEVEKDTNEKLKTLTDGDIETTGQRDKILNWCADNFFFLDNLQANTVKETLEQDDLPDNIRAILDLKQIMGKSSIRKFQAMVNRIDLEDNRIRELVRYCGAPRTRRWSGQGIQVQNLARGEYKDLIDTQVIIDLVNSLDLDDLDFLYNDRPMDALSSILRAVLCASKGKTLISGDYAAIEARILAWVSNCIWAITMFKRGGDPYIDMASRIYGKPIEEITNDDRFMGKRAVLGLGYQMAAKKFMKTLKDDFGIIIESKLAQHIVKTYRDSYWAVTQFWSSMELLAKVAIREGVSRPLKHLPVPISYKVKDNILRCKLPSGRNIYYHEPKLEMQTFTYGKRKMTRETITYMGTHPISKKWVRLHTYGGKLAENICQALSRDILAPAMVKLERKKFPIVLTVHDEIVCEVDKRKADLNEFIKTMCDVPKWAGTLPVNADGWVGKRYRK